MILNQPSTLLALLAMALPPSHADDATSTLVRRELLDVADHSLIRSIHKAYVAAGREASGIPGRDRRLQETLLDDAASTDAWTSLHSQATVPDLRWSSEHHLLVEILGINDDDQLRDALLACNDDGDALKVEITACSNFLCTAYLDMDHLQDVEDLAQVSSIRPAFVVTQQADSPFALGSGPHINEAIQAMRVDEVQRRDPTLSGKGVKIGVLSDSYANRGKDANRDIIAGDVPPMNTASGVVGPTVTILKDAPSGMKASDEGRAMVQLIHDVAPDADILFHTATGGILDFMNGIQKLADAGCDVIVDDVGFPATPMFQDGPVTQVINDIVQNQNISYFAAVGNMGRNAWEGAYVPSGQEDLLGCTFHDFGGGNIHQELNVKTNGAGHMVFQWNDPWFSISGPPGATTDINVFLFDANKTLVTMDPTNNIGTDPIAFITIPSTGRYYFAAGVCGDTSNQQPSSPLFMKWALLSGAIDARKYADPRDIPFAPTIFGHANAEFAASVGATTFFNSPAYGVQRPISNPFSSVGGTPIYVAADGSRLDVPIIRQQPRFSAPDLCLNSFFGAYAGISVSNSPTSKGYFFIGSSASVSNAAAVAAIIVQANPNLSPLDIYSIMEDTAVDMNSPGYDLQSGHGLIDAGAALRRVSAGFQCSATAIAGSATSGANGVTSHLKILKSVTTCVSVATSDDALMESQLPITLVSTIIAARDEVTIKNPEASNSPTATRKPSAAAVHKKSSKSQRFLDAGGHRNVKADRNEKDADFAASFPAGRKTKQAWGGPKDTNGGDPDGLDTSASVHTPICLFDAATGDFATICMDVIVIDRLPAASYRCGCCTLGDELCRE